MPQDFKKAIFTTPPWGCMAINWNPVRINIKYTNIFAIDVLIFHLLSKQTPQIILSTCNLS